MRDERRSLIRSPDGLDQFGTQHVLIALISHQESVISDCTSILPLSRRTVRFWFGGEVVYLHTLYMSYTDNNLVSLQYMHTCSKEKRNHRGFLFQGDLQPISGDGYVARRLCHH